MGESSKSGSRQRRHPRFQVRDVRGSFPVHFEVEVFNMSLTGLAVEFQRPLEIGREYQINLQTGDEGLELKSEVRWCHLVRTERSNSEVIPVYRSGLDFRSALEEKALEVLTFLQHHMVIDAERHINGRFKVTLEGPAKVTEYHDFGVPLISFSGMLIETDLLLEVGSSLDIELHAGDREFQIPGRVAHSQLLTEPKEKVCRAGIAFGGLDEETARALEEVTRDFLV